MDRKGSCPTHEEQFVMERKNSVPSEKRRACYCWAMTGMCRLGNSCRYAHDDKHAYVPPDYTHRLWSDAQASTSQAGSSEQEEQCTFTVMSYNILADELALTHARELYKAVPDHCLPWPGRHTKLMKELLHWQPDIICLQEVDHPEHFTGPLQPLGYDSQYAGRTGGRKDGCMTLWRAEKFQVVAYDIIKMNEHNLRDNVALVVFLKPRASPQAPTLAIANTHLLFNPKRGDIKVLCFLDFQLFKVSFTQQAMDKMIKLGQVGLVLRRMSAICQDLGLTPLAIFTGDFNSTPQSAICSFIRTGELDCFLEDRRMLSGQLEFGAAWPPKPVVQREMTLGKRMSDRKRGASLDDPSRWLRTSAGPSQVNQHQPKTTFSGVSSAGHRPPSGIALSQQQFASSLAHSSSTPQMTSLVNFSESPAQPSFSCSAVLELQSSKLLQLHERGSPVQDLTPAALRDVRHSGPVMSPGQGPMYPYTDEFGQIVWSHVPPTDSEIKRQPFYHQPMVVEEARPPPPPPSGILRSMSFAKRQANADTWTREELQTATGCLPAPQEQGVGKRRGRKLHADDMALAEHPMPMQSAYEAVLGTEPAYTSCHGKFIGTVDYVWFTPQAGEFKLTPTNVLLPPPLESLHCGLPSPEWPSDHISLMSHFTLARMKKAGPPSSAPSRASLSSVKEEYMASLDSGLSFQSPVRESATKRQAQMSASAALVRLEKSVAEGIVPKWIVSDLQNRYAA